MFYFIVAQIFGALALTILIISLQKKQQNEIITLPKYFEFTICFTIFVFKRLYRMFNELNLYDSKYDI